jgi:branched-chain amino acid transport system substrate-binding protein|tara:strand:- start:3180 stop:4346 length:1167 start_codon:yes stop_codon:yes gene_type:complete
MKRFNAIALMLTLLWIGCENRTTSPGVTDEEILIGNIQDLSGPIKELGLLIPAGQQMYFDYINSGGGVHGRQIKMIIEDHGYNPQKAVVAAKKLIEKDQVFCLYAVIGTSPAEAIRPILEESGVPLIAPATNSSTMSDMSNQAAKYIFHTDAGYDLQTRVLIDYILEKNADAVIGLVYQDDDYGTNALKGCAEAEAKHGVTVQKEAYQRGAADFLGQTMNMMKGGVTDLIIGGIVREPVTIMKTAQAMKYKPEFYGLGPTVDPRVGLLAGAAGEGFTAAYWAYYPDSDESGPTLYRELCDKNNVPEKMRGIYHYYGFATAHVLVEGLRRAGKYPTRERLMEGLETLNNWDSGVFPPITYNRKDHAGVESVLLLQLQGGKQVAITDWLD